jgi:hypothetical protein
MLSYCKSIKIEDDYLMVIADNLLLRPGSSFKTMAQRSKRDQLNFRNRLIETYSAEGDALFDQLVTPTGFPAHLPIWCPLSQKE